MVRHFSKNANSSKFKFKENQENSQHFATFGQVSFPALLPDDVGPTLWAVGYGGIYRVEKLFQNITQILRQVIGVFYLKLTIIKVKVCKHANINRTNTIITKRKTCKQ